MFNFFCVCGLDISKKKKSGTKVMRANSQALLNGALEQTTSKQNLRTGQ